METKSIYLDNAATSWPKPPGVLAAIQNHFESLGACAGRSSYREAAEVERLINDTRRQIAYLFGLHHPERVIHAFNGTDSLNIALHGLLGRDNHVITTCLEHNSVLRPLAHMQRVLDLQVTYLEPGEDGRVSPTDVEQAIRPNTRLIAVTHASNVTGILQPVEEIFDVARRRGIRMLVDAAQTVGHIDFNLGDCPIDLVAFSGHKGLMGPLGTGVLIVQPEVAEEMESLRQGGTGSASDKAEQPTELPQKFESGNSNVPGILGLRAAVQYIREETISALQRQQTELIGQLLAGLGPMDSIHVHGGAANEHRVNVVSLTVKDFDPHELAAALDSAFQIKCRAGLHCAPLAHQYLGTLDTGGTIRISLGAFNTSSEIDTLLKALRAITH
ncbi:MAG: aminotransferase class V-fold PLP-dependent enzyme [Pirellulaceae bacterium]